MDPGCSQSDLVSSKTGCAGNLSNPTVFSVLNLTFGHDALYKLQEERHQWDLSFLRNNTDEILEKLHHRMTSILLIKHSGLFLFYQENRAIFSLNASL